MPRFQLVEPQGKPLGAPSNRAIWPLASRHFEFFHGDPASGPLLSLHPLLLRDLPPDVGEGSGERTLLRPVRVCPALHTMSIRLVCCKIGPVIGLFIVLNAFVRWALSDLNGDIRCCSSKCSDVLSRCQRVFLSRSQFVR